MNKKIIFLILVFIGMIVVLNACYYDKEQLLTPPKSSSTGGNSCQSYSFATTVNPIFQASCSNGTGCHGAGSSNGPGALTTYTEIKNNITQIQASISAGRMPLGSSLSASQIQIITCWVSNGSLNN